MRYWEVAGRPSGRTWKTTRRAYPAWKDKPGVPGFPDRMPYGRAALHKLLAQCEQVGPDEYRLPGTTFRVRLDPDYTP